MAGQESRSSSGADYLDELFAVLGDRQRRRVLARLLDRPSTRLDELLPAVEEGERERAEVQLYHVHLPTLDDADFVEWDGDRRISRGSKFEAVAPVIELLADHTERLPGEWP